MDDNSKSKMFLVTLAGIALTLGPIEIGAIIALRTMGAPWFVDLLIPPMGVGIGFLSVGIAARMWKV